MNSLVRAVTKNQTIFRRTVGLLREPVRNSSFKSLYALENLYPTSNPRPPTPTFVPDESNEQFSGFIPMDKLTITYSHSSGPGGQNVNAANSKVDLRFQVANATWLSDLIKEKLAEQEKNRINKEGFLVIKSEVTRSQQLNLADALERLRTMIRRSVPKPNVVCAESEERRRKMALKRARERVFQKRMRSQIKQERNAENFV